MDKEQVTQRAHELENAMRSLKHTKLIPHDGSGLKGSEKHFIWLLANLNNGEPVMPSEAAKKLNVTLAAVTHYINSLEEQGYVTRSASADDKRVVFIALSDTGKDTAVKLRNGYFEKMRGLVEHLGDEDSSELIALIAKMSEYFKTCSIVK